MNPIIDPSTLTEKQREAIKKVYEAANKCKLANCISIRSFAYGQTATLDKLFGKGFFKKKEVKDERNHT